MKKLLHTLTLVLICFVSCYCQNISISVGTGKNQFHSFGKESNFPENIIDFRLGRSQLLKLDFTKMGNLPFFDNMSITLKKSRGRISIGSILGLNSSSLQVRPIFNTEIVDKLELSLGTQPIEMNLRGYIKVRLGIQLTKIVKSGYKFNDIDYPQVREPINFNTSFQTKSFKVDALIELQFGRVETGTKIIAFPFYTGSFGLTPEFTGSTKTYSIQHNLGLAIEWRSLKK